MKVNFIPTKNKQFDKMSAAMRKNMQNLKKFFIRTYGCQMNELDSQLMIGLLEKRGLIQTDSEKDADLIIYNTCSIRDLAERKVMGKLGILSRKKKRALIGIAGCMVSLKKEKLIKKFGHIDFLIGTNNVHEINNILDKHLKTKEKGIHISEKSPVDIDYLAAKRESSVKAYVSIMRGCNNFCTYCVVPFARGREISRPANQIIDEVKHLVDKGYKEVMLLGQNVNSYGKGSSISFAELLGKLDSINGLERIRFLTSNPHDMTRDIMYAMKDLPSVCEFLHFPFQSGSDRVLKKMNRKYTKNEYLEKAAALKEIVPNIKLGTDIIVGFPTETDEDYQDTIDVFTKIGFSLAFIFAYSPRKNTVAYRFEDDVSKKVKQQRLQTLLFLYEQMLAKEKAKMIGSSYEILVERKNKDNRLKGKTRSWDKVIFDGDESLIGKTQKVKITDYKHQTLIGK